MPLVLSLIIYYPLKLYDLFLQGLALDFQAKFLKFLKLFQSHAQLHAFKSDFQDYSLYYKIFSLLWIQKPGNKLFVLIELFSVFSSLEQ